MVRNRRPWVVFGKKYEVSPFEKLMLKEPLEKCQRLISVALRLFRTTTFVFTKLSICSQNRICVHCTSIKRFKVNATYLFTFRLTPVKLRQKVMILQMIIWKRR